MLKTMAMLPLLMLIVISVGIAGCAGGGLPLHAREMTAAALVMLISAEAACLPALLWRKADTATMSQAALAGTVIQMLLSFALAAALWLAGVRLAPTPFVAWMMAFYWTTLAALVIAMSFAIRRAPSAAK